MQTKMCENFSCEIGNCHLRHPKYCKYYSEFSRFKSSEYCLFKHVRIVNQFDILTKENYKNKTKIVTLEENLKDKEMMINKSTIWKRNIMRVKTLVILL